MIIISSLIVIVLIIYIPIAVHGARKYKINSTIKIILLSIIILTGCAEAGVAPWPGGRIPVVMTGFTEEESFEIFQGMLIWEMASGGAVKFVLPGKDEVDPVIITKTESSFPGLVIGGAGYNPSRQKIIILETINKKIIIHELGHLIGLNHEHQRPDRDLYITINNDVLNCYPSLIKLQFVFANPELYQYDNYPYDYKSVMHYDHNESLGIIESDHELSGELPSIIDAMKIRDIYNIETENE